MNKASIPNLSQYIDHTLLRPDAQESEIRKVCSEAIDSKFKTVCVELKWLSLTAKLLEDSGVLPITVIGFPKGNESTQEKLSQVKSALECGAKEIDMVLNRDLLTAGKLHECQKDMEAVVRASAPVPVKVILEISELSEQQIIVACALAKAAQVAFVKTSTGFSKSGATTDAVALMRQVVGKDTGVKASGGIRTFEDAKRMIDAGASRLGTSASVGIVAGNPATSEGY